ncbi:MAG: flagellar hook assembly protein FlgD [Desulfuromonadaceae bacterium]|nr:flagellar hook assembly protein FlgD [Desulfuromonadaceae bacterium]
MVSTVTGTTDTTATAAAMKKSLGMNKDDFMKLFIAQLQYQDPMKPQDPSAMLDQLSQLSLVEQSYNSNTALKDLLTAQNNSISLTALSFIGKDVKANGNVATFDGTAPCGLVFDLSLPSASTQLSIVDASGRTVKTADLGASKAGENSIYWDGRDSSGALLPAGAYTFSVKAASATGSTVPVTTFTTGRIDGVNLASGTPQLNIGASSVALADVISVKGV